MRCSCIEKNRCRVAINKERTENDVGIFLSLFRRNTINMATSSGGRLGVEHFPCLLKLLAVASRQGKYSTLNRSPLHVAMSTVSLPKKLKKIPMSFSVRFLLIATRHLFFSIQEPLILLYLKIMLVCITLHSVTCHPLWKFLPLVLDGRPLG